MKKIYKKTKKHIKNTGQEGVNISNSVFDMIANVAVETAQKDIRALLEGKKGITLPEIKKKIKDQIDFIDTSSASHVLKEKFLSFFQINIDDIEKKQFENEQSLKQNPNDTIIKDQKVQLEVLLQESKDLNSKMSDIMDNLDNKEQLNEYTKVINDWFKYVYSIIIDNKLSVNMHVDFTKEEKKFTENYNKVEQERNNNKDIVVQKEQTVADIDIQTLDLQDEASELIGDHKRSQYIKKALEKKMQNLSKTDKYISSEFFQKENKIITALLDIMNEGSDVIGTIDIRIKNRETNYDGLEGEIQEIQNKIDKITKDLKKCNEGQKSKLQAKLSSFSLKLSRLEAKHKPQIQKNKEEIKDFQVIKNLRKDRNEEIDSIYNQKQTEISELNSKVGNIEEEITEIGIEITSQEEFLRDNLTNFTDINIAHQQSMEENMQDVLSQIEKAIEKDDKKAQEFVQLIGNLSKVDLKVKKEISKDGFDQEYLDRIQELYTAGESLGLKRTKPISQITSLISGFASMYGVMNIIPGLIGEPKMRNTVLYNLYTNSAGEMDQTILWGTGIAILGLVYWATSNLKLKIDEHVKSKNKYKLGGRHGNIVSNFFGGVGNFYTTGSFRDRVAKYFGTVGILFSIYSNIGGISSGTIGKDKKAKEKEKIEAAVTKLTSAFDVAESSISNTDNMTSANIESVLSAKASGGAASGRSGKGPYYFAKKAVDEGIVKATEGTTASITSKGKLILKQAGATGGEVKLASEGIQSILDNVDNLKHIVLQSAGKTIPFDEIADHAMKYVNNTMDPGAATKIQNLGLLLSKKTYEISTILIDGVGKYNNTMGLIQKIYNNIEAQAKSGAKIEVELVNVNVINKQIETMKLEVKEIQKLLNTISPYVEGINTYSVLKEDLAKPEHIAILLTLAIILLGVMIDAGSILFSYLGVLRRRRNTLKQFSQDYNNTDENNLLDSLESSMNMYIQGVGKAIGDDTYIRDAFVMSTQERIYSEPEFGSMIDKLYTGKTLTERELLNQDRLETSMIEQTKKDFISFMSDNLDTVFSDYGPQIDQDMKISNQVLSHNTTPFSYIQYYNKLIGHNDRSKGYFILAFLRGSKTFRDIMLDNFVAERSVGGLTLLSMHSENN